MIRSLGIVWILCATTAGMWLESRLRADGSDVEVYYFGLHAEQNPSRMFGKFKPMLSHLSEQVSRQLERPVKFKLHLVDSPEEAIEALVAGKLHVARLHPAAYVLARDSDEGVHLLAKELNEGRDRQETVLVALASSRIHVLDDLHGKSVALSEETETTDRETLWSALLDGGLRWSEFDRVDRAGRHRDVAKAVLNGEHEAGAIPSRVFEKYRERGLREIATVEQATKPWVASPTLDRTVIEALHKALIETDDLKVLSRVERGLSGFDDTRDADYEEVRVSIGRGSRLTGDPGRSGGR